MNCMLRKNLWVIDTDAQEVLSMVDTGDNPVHLYAIPPREEIWTHPDTGEWETFRK